MAKQLIDLTSTSLELSACTIDWCKTVEDGTTVATSGADLIERGNGLYVFDNPDVTEDSDFRIHETADDINYAIGYLSPADGDLALNSTSAKEATVSSHETARATMETTLVAEHDSTQDSVNLLQDSVDNIGGGVLRIQTSLVDQVLDPTNDKWIKVLVVINDAIGVLFDPADIVDPGVGREYIGAGAVFSDISSTKVTMYKDNLATPLDSVELCHHTAQSNQPQILERDASGIYYFWMNATAVGDALPIGQLKALFGFFDITQTAATYSGSSPFLIQDTEPSSHIHILDVINVLEDTGTNERLDGIDSELSEIKGSGFDTGVHSLKEIKNRIG